MTAQSNAPVIIKRKKVVSGGGHHGGAWKVAYADFVTAMMAFFMLMWLLGATTEKQRKGIADYFNPTIPVVRASGGGSGAFGGDSVFSEESMSRSGMGAGQTRPTDDRQARGETGITEADADEASGKASTGKDAALASVESTLRGLGGESMVSELLQRHVVTRLSDEGLVIELFDTEDLALFEDRDRPSATLQVLLGQISQVISVVSNDVAIGAHSRAMPLVKRENSSWDLTSDRAQAVRGGLEAAGLDPARISRVTGFADRDPISANPMAPRNSRVEIVLLRGRV